MSSDSINSLQKYKKVGDLMAHKHIFCTFASMKTFQGSFLRAIVSIIGGILLVEYRMDTLHWLTVAIGGLFFLSGAVSCIHYWLERKRVQKALSTYEPDGTQIRPKMPFVPIVGVGSLILGGILAAMPDTFLSGVAIVLAAILILGALNQLIALGQARQYSTIPAFFWLLPLVTLCVGVFILVKPMETMATPLLIIGWCMMFYGVVECLNAIKIYKIRRAFEKAEEARISEGQKMINDTEDAVIIEEKE